MTNYTKKNYLNYCINKIYIPAGLKLTKDPIWDYDSKKKKYGACLLYLNDKKVLFRMAKVTKNRPGAFVTVWKRCEHSGNIIPYDYEDCIDYIFIMVKGYSKENKKYYEGQFTFNKNILMKKNIISKNKIGGKLSMRIIPPWSEELSEESIRISKKESLEIKKTQKMSKSAKITQAWQLKYFSNFSDKNRANFNGLKEIFYTI